MGDLSPRLLRGISLLHNIPSRPQFLPRSNWLRQLRGLPSHYPSADASHPSDDLSPSANSVIKLPMSCLSWIITRRFCMHYPSTRPPMQFWILLNRRPPVRLHLRRAKIRLLHSRPEGSPQSQLRPPTDRIPFTSLRAIRQPFHYYP